KIWIKNSIPVLITWKSAYKEESHDKCINIFIWSKTASLSSLSHVSLINVAGHSLFSCSRCEAMDHIASFHDVASALILSSNSFIKNLVVYNLYKVKVY
ncbi:MAG: hypothetical protein ABS933_03070, partial [Priestia megaterium]